MSVGALRDGLLQLAPQYEKEGGCKRRLTSAAERKGRRMPSQCVRHARWLPMRHEPCTVCGMRLARLARRRASNRTRRKSQRPTQRGPLVIEHGLLHGWSNWCHRGALFTVWLQYSPGGGPKGWYHLYFAYHALLLEWWTGHLVPVYSKLTQITLLSFFISGFLFSARRSNHTNVSSVEQGSSYW